MRNKKRKKKPVILSLVAVLIVAAGIGGALIYINRGPKTDKESKTTSTAPTAQENFSQGDERTPSKNTPNEGSATPVNPSSSLPPTSEWTVSKDNVITVYAPAQNSVINDGYVLSGKSSAPTISYRLIDSVSGVIARGQLPVTNGSFAGKFSFSTTAPEGRVDVFIASPDGVESSNIEIPVRFK